MTEREKEMQDLADNIQLKQKRLAFLRNEKRIGERKRPPVQGSPEPENRDPQNLHTR